MDDCVSRQIFSLDQPERIQPWVSVVHLVSADTDQWRDAFLENRANMPDMDVE
ncbi:hypothetical protein PHMEG_00028340 [Phytophthora megakarya]|uniref:Uncharacterized protein n=1 Tax=Phytophthora megakarya TaxID=4795 RepID=A0A225V7P8_9STRA|nr:hypothetical protein PHMEG_00028340 [Phytophthora megakarya]